MHFDSPDPKDSTPIAKNRQKPGLVGMNEKYHMPPHSKDPFPTTTNHLPQYQLLGTPNACLTHSPQTGGPPVTY